ncbi:MAG: hypothetical protein U0P81_15175 [Holophagaceae bacterium]
MDSSWDNGGQGPAPARRGWPVWVKVLLGCGVVMLLGLGACVGAGFWLGQKAKRDPEGFKRGALGFAVAAIRPEYDRGAGFVDQLLSEAGTRALWAQQPGIHAAFGDEAAFLAAAAGWRPHLHALPPLEAEHLEKNRMQLQKDVFTGVRFGYRMDDGTRIRMAWNPSTHALTSLECDVAPAGRSGASR